MSLLEYLTKNHVWSSMTVSEFGSMLFKLYCPENTPEMHQEADRLIEGMKDYVRHDGCVLSRYDKFVEFMAKKDYLKACEKLDASI